MKELDLEIGQKIILLIKFANYNIQELNNDDVKETANYVFGLSDNNQILKTILIDLGYSVKIENDELTANW